nr:hypothetical protein [Tanacetum cinerariifolium]
MADLAFAPQHNMIAYLEKTKSNVEFHQIVDFFTSSSIYNSLTISPTIYASNIEQFWNSATSQTINDEKQIHVIVDGKTVVITESSVRRDLLFTDANGITLVEGEGSGNPPKSQPTPSPTQPINESQIPESSSSPQNTQSPRQTLEGTGTPHTRRPNFPYPMVDVEVVHKEKDDSLVRAATTASLDAQQDSSNITKTQSKATLNEPTPQGEGSGSIPRHQETIGVGSREDMMEHEIELTYRVPQTPYDSPLSRGHTPRSDEGRMTLEELTDLCTTLLQKVFTLENVKTAQAKEIANKGNGEKGGSTSKTVSAARLDISADRPEDSTVEPKTSLTTTTLFNDEDVTVADTFVKIKNQKAKE